MHETRHTETGLGQGDSSSRSLLLVITPGHQRPPEQEPSFGPPKTIGLSFAASLPPNWRSVTVDEEIILRSQLPADMRRLIPGHRVAYGPVDRWLESGFDGTALLAELSDASEIPVDETGIEQIRDRWESFTSPNGGRRTVLSAHTIELGSDHHAAIECRIRSTHKNGGHDLEALEFYIPTGGHMLILSFRSWDDAFPEALPTFRNVAETLTFAQPPQGPEELADRLFYAALIGAIFGLLLLAANQVRRQRNQ